MSTLGKPGGLYGGSVLGFHERNAGTAAFSPAAGNITRAVASGVVTPGPGRISLAGGGSPRVGVRAPRDDESDGEDSWQQRDRSELHRNCVNAVAAGVRHKP